MTTSPDTAEPFKVVIVGGGVAAIEAALALHELAGDLVDLRLVAPEPEFVYRPMTVREPFAYAAARRYPIAEIAADIGAELVPERLSWVDRALRSVHTESGQRLRYDALVLGLGAKPSPRYQHAITLNDQRMDELLHGMVQDVEEGYSKRLAFVIAAPIAWPLPIYELALLTAGRAHDMNVNPAITIITPEEAPLAVFGENASRAVSRLLAISRIDVLCSAYCDIPEAGQIEIRPGNRTLEVDRVIALPELHGPSVRGVPADPGGFIPVDSHCRVRGTSGVFAAGDATDFAVKHGGIAAQQADTVAQAIAVLAGAKLEAKPFDPVLRGMLLTASKPLYMHAYLAGGHGFASEVTDEPTWTPPGKIAADYLGRYLETRDRVVDEGELAPSAGR